MGRTRLFLVVVGVLVMGLVTSSAAGGPYDAAENYDGCSAIVVDPTVVCATDSSASAGTGAIAVATSLKSRLQSYAPTVASGAYAFGSVRRLVENGPVSALRVTATIHVIDANLHVISRPALVGEVAALVTADIRMEEKGQRCNYIDTYCAFNGGAIEIATLRETGDLHLEDQEFTVSGILFACGGLPAGSADVIVTVSSSSQIGSLTAPSAGESVASVDAVVTNLTVEPVPAPPGMCF